MNADLPVESPAQLCARCGRSLPGDRPRQLCPYCLLASDPPPSLPGGVGRFVPPDPDALQASFPHLDVGPLLGHGGMGAVYRARQRTLGRDVALKILPPEIAAAEGFTDRFAREARALGRLSHPNVVAIFDHGTAGPYAFLVMELVEGINLRELMGGGPLPAEEALRIVPQLCDALQYAHRQGVIHRDIKPENILIDEAGRVKITDFGLAKLISGDDDHARTGTRQVMGTLHYMAPEQFERPREVDHRADLYSLGVVFYELLTGELPLGRFDPPSEKSNAGRQVDYVVLKSLEKEPARRYGSASEVRSDLDRAQSAGSGEHWRTTAARLDRNVRRAGRTARSAVSQWSIEWLQFSIVLLHVVFYALLCSAVGVVLDAHGAIWLGVVFWMSLVVWAAAYGLDYLAARVPLPASLALLGRPVTVLARLPSRFWIWLKEAGSGIDGLRLPLVAAAWIALAVAAVLTVGGLGSNDDLFAGALAAFILAWLFTRLAVPRTTSVTSAPALWLLCPPAACGLVLTVTMLLLWPLAVWIVLSAVEPLWIEHAIAFLLGHALLWNEYQLLRAHVIGATCAETAWLTLLAAVAAISPATIRYLTRPLLDGWQGGGRWWALTFCAVALALAVGLAGV